MYSNIPLYINSADLTCAFTQPFLEKKHLVQWIRSLYNTTYIIIKRREIYFFQ